MTKFSCVTLPCTIVILLTGIGSSHWSHKFCQHASDQLIVTRNSISSSTMFSAQIGSPNSQRIRHRDPVHTVFTFHRRNGPLFSPTPSPRKTFTTTSFGDPDYSFLLLLLLLHYPFLDKIPHLPRILQTSFAVLGFLLGSCTTTRN